MVTRGEVDTTMAFSNLELALMAVQQEPNSSWAKTMLLVTARHADAAERQAAATERLERQVAGLVTMYGMKG